MLFNSVVSTLALTVAGAAHAAQDQHQGAVNARTLVERESLATLMTVYQDGDFAGAPAGQVEYYADCDKDGSLYFIGMHISTAFHNIDKGSNASMTVRVGDHSPQDNGKVDTNYPGAVHGSIMGSPRVSLTGKVKALNNIDDKESQRLASCLQSRHHDVQYWVPGTGVHGAFWAKFEPSALHYIGGFGDRAYIGNIPGDVYRDAKPNSFLFVHE